MLYIAGTTAKDFHYGTLTHFIPLHFPSMLHAFCLEFLRDDFSLSPSENYFSLQHQMKNKTKVTAQVSS